LVDLFTVPTAITTEVRKGGLSGFSFGDVIVREGSYLFVNFANVHMQNCINEGSLWFGDYNGRPLQAASYTGGGELQETFYGAVHTTFTVTGQADITGGKLQFVNLQGDFVSGTYTIIQAGSLIGRLAVEPNSSIFEQFQTVYSSSALREIITRTGAPYSAFARTRNQRAVTGALDTSDDHTDSHARDLSHIAFGAATITEVQRQYNLFSGDVLASFQDIGLRHAGLSMDVIRGRAGLPMSISTSTSVVTTVRAWVQGIGSFDRTQENVDIGSPASQTTTNGFQAGYDLISDDQWRLGLSGGYLKSTISIDDRQFSGDATSVESGLYASFAGSRWFFDGSTAYIGTKNHGVRPWVITVADPGAIMSFEEHGTPVSNFASRTIGATIETGMRFRPKSLLSLEPKGSLSWNRLQQDSFVESPSEESMALIVDPHTVNSVISSLGLRVVGKIGERRGHPLKLAASVDWKHELASNENEITARYDETGPRFSVQATPRFRNAAVLGTDARLTITRSLEGFFQYQYTAGDAQQSHALNGGLRLQW